MNTDYNLYKIFLYLFEEKSISKTASKLYVSQPAISYSLKELENQLGYTLFYRNSKGIEPTTEAKELYGYISTAFHILNDAEEHIKNLNQLSTGCIRIGVPSYIGMFYLSYYVLEFRKQYPGIKFEILCRPNNEMIEMLETRKLDMILGTLPMNSKKDVTKTSLGKLQVCFAYHRNYNEKINCNKISDINNYPVILPIKESYVRSKLDEYLDKNNIRINPIIECSSNEVLLEMVRKGIGIGCFMRDVLDIQIDKDNFKVLEFSDLPSINLYCFTIDEYLTVAASKFIELLKEK